MSAIRVARAASILPLRSLLGLVVVLTFAGVFSSSASAPAAAAAVAGPGFVSVGPTGRYLVDQSGAPFLITGDSPQAMIGVLTDADAEYFFADRKAYGFNTVWINLLCNSYTGCNADGSTWDGIAPFTTPGDFSTPNEAYFGRADRIIRLAGQHGLVVILDPAETGGWLGTMVANGVDNLRAYGRYLGERYKDFPNIIWMSGNDYQDWGPTNDPYVTAVAQGIQDVDTRHIQTVELNYPTSSSLDDPTWAPIIRLNASYTHSSTYEQVLTDYNRPNFLPTFLVEGTYEFEQNNSSYPYGDPHALRRQEYWSILSGATGQLYGNHYTWGFLCNQRDNAGNCIDGWKSQLDTPGAVQVGYLTALLEPRAWYDLVPDQAHTVVTAGYGVYGADDYVTAARTPDGTLAMAYVPTARTITVGMSKLSGPVTARWYDPAAGSFTPITGSPFTNTGDRQFTTPGNNADGNEDWVLVLEVPPIVNDTTPPVLNLPADVVVEASGPTGTTVNYTVSATDTVDPSPTVDCSPPSGSVFPLDATTVSCAATDASGNSAEGSFTITVVEDTTPVVEDTTPPVLSLPADIVVDATRPAGAAVTYTVTATDTVDPSPTVACSPAWGDVFAIGTTTVNCLATDEAGNTATANFTVHVKGAAEQLDDLAVAVQDVGSDSLATKIAQAQQSLAQGQTQATCSTLATFRNKVQAQSGKQIPTEQATALIADANRISAVLGC
jgi:Protein of unknown function (DUF4038)/Putative collagen-binding domain of a collagenase/HYR domain